MLDLWLFMNNSASLMFGIKIPAYITRPQCIFFLVLYSVLILSEMADIPNTVLVLGAAHGECSDLTQHDSGESDSLFGRSA